MNLTKFTKQLFAVLPYFLFTVLVFSFNGCAPDETFVPPPIDCAQDLMCHVGDDENYVAAFCNNEVWISGYESFSLEPEIIAKYYTETRALDIVAYREYEDFDDLVSFGAITNGTIGTFDSSFGQESSYRDFNSPCLSMQDGSGKYELNTALPTTFEIVEFNMESQIVSGFFSFHVKNIKPEICEDNITIREGVFRCSFNVVD